MRRLLFIPIVCVSLSGCASTSFAPPPVAVGYVGDGDLASAACQTGGSRGASVQVTRDVQGAYRLVDTFIEAYRCSAHSAANGRQAFEIPAFLATTGAAAAVALGGGATYGIVGTGANALFNGGSKYWDPKLKAAIYDQAFQALLCVKTEAVGISAFKFDNAIAEQNAVAMASPVGAGGNSRISVPVDQQYFEMVSSAAFSVERILSQRLSNMAPVDAGAVAAELGKAIEDARAKEKERQEALAGAGAKPPPAGGADGDDGGQLIEGFWAQRFAAAPKQATVDLDLAVLRPKLDECVIRAKL